MGRNAVTSVAVTNMMPFGTAIRVMRPAATGLRTNRTHFAAARSPVKRPCPVTSAGSSTRRMDRPTQPVGLAWGGTRPSLYPSRLRGGEGGGASTDVVQWKRPHPTLPEIGDRIHTSLEPQGSTVFDALEVFQPPAHHLGTRLFYIAQRDSKRVRRHGGGLARATRKGRHASVSSSGRSRFRPRI